MQAATGRDGIIEGQECLGMQLEARPAHPAALVGLTGASELTPVVGANGTSGTTKPSRVGAPQPPYELSMIARRRCS